MANVNILFLNNKAMARCGVQDMAAVMQQVAKNCRKVSHDCEIYL